MASGGNAFKAIKLLCKIGPITAIFIAIILLILGLVLRMTGHECLGYAAGYSTVNTYVNVNANGNYNAITVSPSYYDASANNGNGQVIAAITAPNPAPDNSIGQYPHTGNYTYMGNWVNSGVTIDGGTNFSISTQGTINVCNSQATTRSVAVNASNGNWTSTARGANDAPGAIATSTTTAVGSNYTIYSYTDTNTNINSSYSNWVNVTPPYSTFIANANNNLVTSPVVSTPSVDGGNVTNQTPGSAVIASVDGGAQLPVLIELPTSPVTWRALNVGDIVAGNGYTLTYYASAPGVSGAFFQLLPLQLVPVADPAPMFVNYGDTLDIELNFPYNDDPSAYGNKWAFTMTHSNAWCSGTYQTCTGPLDSQKQNDNYLNPPGSVTSTSGPICNFTGKVSSDSISYTVQTFSNGCYVDCDSSYTFGNSIPCVSGITTSCRNGWGSAPTPSSGSICWMAKGYGLLGALVSSFGSTPPTPSSSQIFADSNSPDQTYLDMTLNPLTRSGYIPGISPNPNTPNGGSPAPNAGLPNNYYGYYSQTMDQQGYLFFHIDNAHPTSISTAGGSINETGGYVVTTTDTPAPCLAMNGAPASHYSAPTTSGGLPGQTAMTNNSGQLDVIWLPSGSTPGNSASPAGAVAIPMTGSPPAFTLGSASQYGVSGNGQLWFRVHDDNADHPEIASNSLVGGTGGTADPNYSYSLATGSYNVLVSVNNATALISAMIDGIVSLIHPVLFGDPNNLTNPSNGILQNSFIRITTSSDFMKGVRALVTLYIISYFLMFMMGIVECKQTDLVIRLVKIGTVLALIQPNSWEFFSTNLFNLYINAGTSLLTAMTGGGGSESMFSFLDKTVGVIFQPSTIINILGLFMVFPIGWFLAILIFYGFWDYVLCCARAVLSYMVSLLVLALMLSMAPIFICFLLFQQTRPLFTTWMNMSARYVLEPLIMFTGLVMINEIVAITMYAIISNPSCWKCAFSLTIPGYGSFLCFYFYMPWGYSFNVTTGGLDFLTGLLFNCIVFDIAIGLAGTFVNMAPRMAAFITTASAISGTNLTGDVFQLRMWKEGTPVGRMEEEISKGYDYLTGRKGVESDTQHTDDSGSGGGHPNPGYGNPDNSGGGGEHHHSGGGHGH